MSQGIEIQGDALREFEDVPILTAPLVCMLCVPGAGFLTDVSFLQHCVACHGGWAEYRKRVLYLLEARGPHPISAQEKRLMVQNYAFFEQHSLPSAGGNVFKDTELVPRAEAACVVCARLDWLERRYKLRLFAEAPERPGHCIGEESAEESESSGGEERQGLLQVRGEYCLQNPGEVAELLAVERYSQRWPLIPAKELHASSVQHPDQTVWRWLLHTRRVPVMADTAGQQSAAAVGSDGAAEPVAEAPRCAGVGDPEVASWVCWECLADLGRARPRMPLHAFANDNWIGRERVEVRRPPRLPAGSAAWGACAGNSCDSDVARQICSRKASQATPSSWHSRR